jgi:putative hydrolase of the HAD superfamily
LRPLSGRKKVAITPQKTPHPNKMNLPRNTYPVMVFDMDDTLYDERQFVIGGFRAVARMLAERHGVSEPHLLRAMLATQQREGRGRVFDSVLARLGMATRRAVKECLSVYRAHRPNLTLYPAARMALQRLRPGVLYVVTDGNKRVQAVKARALGLDRICRKVYCTHQYGVRHAKPSPYCFELIRRRERCDWRDMVYVGDNPRKDFVGLNPLEVTTVRVLTGAHRHVEAKPGYEARHVIPDLRALFTVPGIHEP